jgi:hypothetical protein
MISNGHELRRGGTGGRFALALLRGLGAFCVRLVRVATNVLRLEMAEPSGKKRLGASRR